MCFKLNQPLALVLLMALILKSHWFIQSLALCLKQESLSSSWALPDMTWCLSLLNSLTELSPASLQSFKSFLESHLTKTLKEKRKEDGVIRRCERECECVRCCEGSGSESESERTNKHGILKYKTERARTAKVTSDGGRGIELLEDEEIAAGCFLCGGGVRGTSSAITGLCSVISNCGASGDEVMLDDGEQLL